MTKRLTPQQCENLGGTIVGDIGDGRIHRPDYRCSNGDKPMGYISYEDEKLRAVEGAVCCAR